MSSWTDTFTAHVTFGSYPDSLNQYIQILIEDVQKMTKQGTKIACEIETDKTGSWTFTLHFDANELFQIASTPLYKDLEGLRHLEE